MKDLDSVACFRCWLFGAVMGVIAGPFIWVGIIVTLRNLGI